MLLSSLFNNGVVSCVLRFSNDWMIIKAKMELFELQLKFLSKLCENLSATSASFDMADAH